MMDHHDSAEYYRFTGPARLDKAIHTLEGILKGILADGKIVSKELSALTGWIGEHKQFSDRHPFNEVIPLLHRILADGVVEPEECADVLWLCSQFSTENKYYDAITADMQRLQGMMGGIAADGIIAKAELDVLYDWIQEHDHLRTIWPYDELEALITDVLKDGVIDEDEHKRLLAFFSEFLSYPGHRALELPSAENHLVSGACAVCPDITFSDRTFCLTGESSEMPRAAIKQLIEQAGGRHSNGVTKATNYLVICAKGNSCWVFSCYGRKVEQAVTYRKKGVPIVLVHELDFWEAARDEELIK